MTANQLRAMGCKPTGLSLMGAVGRALKHGWHRAGWGVGTEYLRRGDTGRVVVVTWGGRIALLPAGWPCGDVDRV